MGKIVEMTETSELLHHPLHPYAEALLSAVPAADPDIKHVRIPLQGEVPSPANPPKGCIFHPRCSYIRDICQQVEPELLQVFPGHFASCHFADELKLRGVGA